MAIEASRFAGKPWWQMQMVAHPVPHRLRLPKKGEHGGECQRIACENNESHWFNATNGRYYCAACARTFNEISRRHGQAPLCELHL